MVVQELVDLVPQDKHVTLPELVPFPVILPLLPSLYMVSEPVLSLMPLESLLPVLWDLVFQAALVLSLFSLLRKIQSPSLEPDTKESQ